MMKPVERDHVLGQLRWRYATKVFDPTRKISAEDWAALEEALLLSPSSYGLQPWTFLVVKNPAVRTLLMAASNNQRQIVDASHMVVFTVKSNLDAAAIDAFVNHIATVRGVSRETLSDFRERMTGKILNGMDASARIAWESRQLYLALGTFLSSAAMMGIDACPMEGIQPTQYDEILGLAAQNLKTVVVATAGYRSATDKYASAPKVRFPKGDVFRYV